MEEPVVKREVPKNSKPRRIVIIGSSVARGSRAASGKGWASLLGQELHRRGHGRAFVLRNTSVGGADTLKTRKRFPTVVPTQQPDIVIIALSLMNEGLLERGVGVCEEFKEGILELIEMVKALNASIIIGGVYPSNSYDPSHYEALKQVQEDMKSWGYPYLDFLSAVDDGQGHWKDDTWADANHPNDNGHRLMFESIPIEEVFGLPPVTPNSRATEETKQEPTSTAEGRGKGEGTRGKRGKGTERGRGNKQRNKRVS